MKRIDAITVPWFDSIHEYFKILEFFIIWPDMHKVNIDFSNEENWEKDVHVFWDGRTNRYLILDINTSMTGTFPNPEGRILTGAAFGFKGQEKIENGDGLPTFLPPKSYFYFYTEDGVMESEIVEDKFLSDRLEEGSMIFYEEYLALKELGALPTE